MFRAVAARGSYLGQCHMDVHVAAKAITRFTSKPEEHEWRSTKRLARYLKDNKRIVMWWRGPRRALQGTSEQEGQR